MRQKGSKKEWEKKLFEREKYIITNYVEITCEELTKTSVYYIILNIGGEAIEKWSASFIQLIIYSVEWKENKNIKNNKNLKIN